MTKEGRLARGKENSEKKIFLENSETIAYIESISKKEEKPVEEKPKKGKKEE